MKAMKAMKVMKAMKTKKVSKVAKGKHMRASVFSGRKVVSQKASAAGKKAYGHQGLDAGGPEGEEGPGLEGLRGCQEGLRAVQGGQGHLQRVSGAPTFDATAT